MKYLVAGGAGFIGSHIAESLLSDGNDVVIYDNFSRASLLNYESKNIRYNTEHLKKNFEKQISIKIGDVLNFSQLSEAAKECSAIFNTAAQVAVTTSVEDPVTDFKINTEGTINVLEVARKLDCPVVFCSTNKVYGDQVNKIKVREEKKRFSFESISGISESFNIDKAHHSPYGCSKLAADLYVQEYHYQYGLKTGVFRMSAIYGPRQFGAEDQGWVSWMVIRTILRKQITIFGNGKQVRDLLYVKDLVNLFTTFLFSNIKHGVFNTGGGNENTLSILELIDLLKELTGIEPKIKFTDWRPADQKVYISDVSKLKEVFNWKPKTNPKEGITKLVNWVIENKSLFI